MAKAALVPVLVVSLGLAGCVAAPPEENACGAAGLQNLIGQDDDVLASMTFPQGTRFIYPGTPVTEDYRPDRLNIDIDPSRRISGVWCG